MAQRFVPEIDQGDKRILLIDGEPVPYALARIPAEGETRVPLIVLTNRAAQGSVDAAVQAIEALDSITGEITRIRVEALDG